MPVCLSIARHAKETEDVLVRGQILLHGTILFATLDKRFGSPFLVSLLPLDAEPASCFFFFFPSLFSCERAFYFTKVPTQRRYKKRQVQMHEWECAAHCVQIEKHTTYRNGVDMERRGVGKLNREGKERMSYRLPPV